MQAELVEGRVERVILEKEVKAMEEMKAGKGTGPSKVLK